MELSLVEWPRRINWNSKGRQKKALDPLEVELELVVNHYVRPGV